MRQRSNRLDFTTDSQPKKRQAGSRLRQAIFQSERIDSICWFASMDEALS
ncbi:hypothetical protein [Lyngbya sp. PCC 8106]|nr:hypothetical protein [Lyngbya sp. PCC 8106]EAW38761.1 30S ribosomal protein S8 [Lyngbya sp. PCC 8106]